MLTTFTVVNKETKEHIKWEDYKLLSQAVYNMASDGKLNYCLDSLAAQTISDYEVITVDDASTDESFSILQEYEKKYPGKFKAVHSEVNKRQGGAKNIGLSLAKGEWIGFIDSDEDLHLQAFFVLSSVRTLILL